MVNNKGILRRKKSNQNYLERQQMLIGELPDNERDEFTRFQVILFDKERNYEGEYWVPITEWEKDYEISNYGRIRNKLTGLIKKPHLHHSCYYTISLSSCDKPKYYILSRLLAIHFIENPGNLPEVNHKNKIRIDCRLNNLEWESSKGNSKHRMSVLCNYDNRKSIVQLSRSGEFIKKWDGISEAARSLGKEVSSGNITTVCQGKNHYAYGYIWMYEEDYKISGVKYRHISKKYMK
jgi:hypothetical protein